MDLERLAAFVFASSPELPPHVTIDVDIEGVDGSKGLFCYFLDLLTRGLFLLFGNAEGNVRLDLLTSNDKERLFGAMRRINVAVIMDPSSPSGEGKSEEELGHLLIDASPARDAPEGLPLEAYHARLRLASGTHDVRFRLLARHRRRA